MKEVDQIIMRLKNKKWVKIYLILKLKKFHLKKSISNNYLKNIVIIIKKVLQVKKLLILNNALIIKV